MPVTASFVEQLDAIVDTYSKFPESPSAGDCIGYIARVRAAVHRIAGKSSPYLEQCEAVLQENASEEWKVDALAGLVHALRADVSAGYLDTYAGLVHGAVFADFLDMADHLASEGYKDAAAVIAGSALEAHLRTLCDAAEVETLAASGRPKKADTLNADLARERVYGLLDQKSVTGWLDLRNNAAHARYDSYSDAQVKLLVAGVRDFMARKPG